MKRVSWDLWIGVIKTFLRQYCAVVFFYETKEAYTIILKDLAEDDNTLSLSQEPQS